MTLSPGPLPEPSVAVGSTQRAWVADLMSYAQDHAGVRVVGTVLSSREALDLTYEVLLIDDTTSFLTRRLVNRVHSKRRIVIGVFDSSRGDVGRARLLDMGADAVIDAESSPREFLARIRHTTDQRRIDADFVAIVGEPSDAVEREPPVQTDRDRGGGRLVVVSGTNGTTEVAIALAASLAGRGASVVLADLDTVTPTVAQRLACDLSPNVLTFIDSLRHVGELDAGGVAHDGGFRVVAGLPSPREWESCAPEEVADLVSELVEGSAQTIVRIDRQLEDLAPFGVRSGRFGVARRLVAEADELVVVGDPSPTGVASLLSWIGDARTLSRAPVHVVLNHCGRSLFQQGEVASEIRRTFNAASVKFAPEDPKVRKAAWQGEIAPQGRFTRTVDGLAQALLVANPAEVL